MKWWRSGLKSVVLNACAGKTRLEHDGEVVRNDLNTEMHADYHYDVLEIDDHFRKNSFDTVVFDPPFDQEQAEEHYDGMHDTRRGPARRKLATAVRTADSKVVISYDDLPPTFVEFVNEDDWFVVERDAVRTVINYRETSETKERLVMNFDPTDAATNAATPMTNETAGD